MADAFQMTWDYDGWFAEMANRGQRMSATARRVLLTDSNRKTVEFWHRVFIPRHFRAEAATRYRYSARKKPYKRIKVALAEGRDVYDQQGNKIEERVIKGGKVSLVRSGEAERRSKNRQLATASPGRASVRVLVPRYVAQRRRSGPNMRQELQRLTATERRQLHTVWSKQFFRGVRQIGTAGLRVHRTT